MALIKIANFILLFGLAGSTDAFAKPRARVARGGASSSKARDAVLINWLLAKARDGDDRAFGVARNIWIYTKEFMMPRKL